MRSRLVILIVLAAGCPRSKGASPPAGDSAALCADLDVLVQAAAGNFAGQRGTAPVQRDGLDGVESTQGIAGAERCAILRPDPAYPDDMVECDLAAAGAAAGARDVLATWQARIAGCPVVAGWASKPWAGGHSWQQETDDNHLLEVQLDLAGEDPQARPVLRVRRPEI